MNTSNHRLRYLKVFDDTDKALSLQDMFDEEEEEEKEEQTSQSSPAKSLESTGVNKLGNLLVSSTKLLRVSSSTRLGNDSARGLFRSSSSRSLQQEFESRTKDAKQEQLTAGTRAILINWDIASLNGQIVIVKGFDEDLNCYECETLGHVSTNHLSSEKTLLVPSNNLQRVPPTALWVTRTNVGGDGKKKVPALSRAMRKDSGELSFYVVLLESGNLHDSDGNNIWTAIEKNMKCISRNRINLEAKCISPFTPLKNDEIVISKNDQQNILDALIAFELVQHVADVNVSQDNANLGALCRVKIPIRKSKSKKQACLDSASRHSVASGSAACRRKSCSQVLGCTKMDPSRQSHPSSTIPNRRNSCSQVPSTSKSDQSKKAGMSTGKINHKRSSSSMATWKKQSRSDSNLRVNQIHDSLKDFDDLPNDEASETDCSEWGEESIVFSGGCKSWSSGISVVSVDPPGKNESLGVRSKHGRPDPPGHESCSSLRYKGQDSDSALSSDSAISFAESDASSKRGSKSFTSRGGHVKSDQSVLKHQAKRNHDVNRDPTTDCDLLPKIDPDSDLQGHYSRQIDILLGYIS